MRKKFSNNKEVAHVWAQQTQSEGEGSHFFFVDNKIYSYGYHFEIARFVDYKGKTCVLFTSRDYSNTTAKHKSMVRNAIPQNTAVFIVPKLELSKENHKDNIVYMQTQVSDSLNNLVKTRKHYDSCLDILRLAVNNYNDYKQFFGLKAKSINFDDIIIPEKLDSIKEKQKAVTLKENQRKALDKAKRLEALTLWANGQPSQYNFYDLPVKLRVKDDQIETSRGAKATIQAGRVLYKKIQANEPIQGAKIEYYTVNGIIGDNLVIGCHEIPLTEVSRIAQLLQW